jgi:hypothetical protein
LRSSCQLFLGKSSFISCTKYAIVSVPGKVNPNILYLKDFRAEIDGWTSKLVCVRCMSYHTEQLQKYTSKCDMSEKYRCNVCLRQTPSLKGTALNFIVKFFFDLQRFELTANTNFQQYIFATNYISLPYWMAGVEGEYPTTVWYPNQFLGMPLLCSLTWATASSSTRFLDHTRRATVGRPPLDE